MARYKKINWRRRVIAPLVIAAITSGGWYGWRNYMAYMPSAPTIQSSTPSPTAKPLPPIHAIVAKQGSDLQLSVQKVPYKDIQRVEFYVENQFVGTAYTEPYSVSVKESDLGAGQHTVTAKIVTDSVTTAAVPANFTTEPTAPTNPSASAQDQPIIISTPATNSVSAPSNVVAAIGASGTSVALTWDASAGAVQYQIWRDGTQLATVTSNTYTDMGLASSQTYAYQILAVDAAKNISDFSSAIGITTPSTNTSMTPVTSPPPSSQTTQPSGAVPTQSPSS